MLPIYKQKTIISFLLVMALMPACGEQPHKKTDTEEVVAVNTKKLVEKQIGKTDYYISIPNDYSITETEGPDFSVYYFSPTDTTIKADFSGGIYMGNHPGEFPPETDTCTTEKLKSRLLNENADWILYNCNNRYALQTIVDSKSEEHWNNFIHAFGNANSTTAMQLLLHIFNTLHIKKSNKKK